MTLKLFHGFISGKADGADATLVRPSDWNAALEYSNAGMTAPSGTDVQVREVLTAGRTYYVRSDGNDSNTGLVNNSGGAFLTIAQGISTILGLDFNSQTVTLQLGTAGTWTEQFAVNSPWVGGGNFIFDGGGATMTRTTGNSSCFVLGATNINGILQCQNVTFTTTGSGGSCVESLGVGTLQINSTVTFGACVLNHIYAHASGANINALSGYTVTGAAGRHYYALFTGAFIYTQGTINLSSGAFNFNPGFAVAADCGVINSFATFSNAGSVTGVRYVGTANGVVNSNAQGANYFPGNSAGTIATGAQYI